MDRLRKLKKIRIHRKGTHIPWASSLLLLLIDAALYWGIGCKIPFYVVVIASTAVYLLMVNFFHCSIRLFGKDTERIAVAPADGKVVVIEEVDENGYFHDRRLMIFIFINITNVHTNWYPVDDAIEKVTHHSSNFTKAWLPKASTGSECSTVVIETLEGMEVLTRQVARAVAQRAVTYIEIGGECYINEHMSFIKFGSRVGMYLPLGTEVHVNMGQSTVGSQTVVAKLK